MPIYIKKGLVLTILVENQGRPCYGSHIGESKVRSSPGRKQRYFFAAIHTIFGFYRDLARLL
jgi:hypothetical protein